MGFRRPISLRFSSGTLRVWFYVLVCLGCLAGVPRASAQEQDVAEAARQEKARKAAQEKPKGKIYTNEDLAKAQIVASGDHARAEAAKKDSTGAPSPSSQASSVEDANKSSQESLGEVARRYRKEKAARAAEQAKQTQSPSLFKLEVTPAPLAAPVQPRPVQPRPVQTWPVQPREVVVLPPALLPAPAKSAMSSAAPRRDPFSHTPASAAPHGFTASTATSEASPHREPSAASKTVPNFTPRRELVPAPVESIRTIVTIQPGDSLWKLARQNLGDGRRWRELASANPKLRDPDRIRPGGVLAIPEASSGMRGMRAGPPTSIVVQEGDSLWKIAKIRFGHGSSYACLAKANPQIRDLQRIEAGQTLLIPASCDSTP